MFQLIFDFNEQQPKYIQIYEQLKNMIEAKKIHANEKLPSIRALANNLQVSRNTTLQAYEALIAEGYVRAESKKGYFINEMEPIYFQNTTVPTKSVENPSLVNAIDFRLGAIDQHHFPLKKWRQISNAILDRKECYTYGECFGEEVFKHELADYLLQARGIQCEPQQIIVGSSTQQLLLQLGLLLQKNFSSIILENPGYYGVAEAFQQLHFSIDPITVNEQGLILEELATKKSSLMYVTPSHQYPFGTALSVKQRWALIQWAHKTHGYIIEDDYDSEYRYGQKTFPALTSLDNTRTIYFGTFSKAFLPGIRIAYMVLPPALLPSYQHTFRHFESTASLLHQLTMAEFMRSGEWERHIKRMRKIYHQKMNTLIENVKRSFPNHVAIIGERAGLYIMLSIDSPFTEEALIEKAMNVGVKVYPTSNLYLTEFHSNPKLLLGFANLSHKQLEEGVARLKKAWHFL